MVNQLLGKFETLLLDPPFIRLGRSLIVNSHRLRGAEAVSHGETRIWLDRFRDPFVLGRAAAAKLKKHPSFPTAPAVR